MKPSVVVPLGCEMWRWTEADMSKVRRYKKANYPEGRWPTSQEEDCGLTQERRKSRSFPSTTASPIAITCFSCEDFRIGADQEAPNRYPCPVCQRLSESVLLGEGGTLKPLPFWSHFGEGNESHQEMLKAQMKRDKAIYRQLPFARLQFSHSSSRTLEFRD